jgi:hypothetical protein
MGQLQRQQVARIMGENLLPFLQGAKKIAAQPGLHRCQMTAFAVVRAAGQGLGGSDRGDHVVIDPGLHRLGRGCSSSTWSIVAIASPRNDSAHSWARSIPSIAPRCP